MDFARATREAIKAGDEIRIAFLVEQNLKSCQTSD